MSLLRERAHAEAVKLIGIMEQGGNNQGREVSAIIHANGGTGPEPWCGDTVAFCYRKAGSKAVTRAWAAVVNLGRLAGMHPITKPQLGDIVCFTFDHTGILECYCDAAGHKTGSHVATHIRTIEGNTGASGAVSDSSTGGDGVYRKVRDRSLVERYVRVTR